MAAAASPNRRLTPADVLSVMQRVADWQLAHPSVHPTTDWTQAAGDAGMMALAGISSDPKYREALLAMGDANGGRCVTAQHAHSARIRHPGRDRRSSRRRLGQ
jgi:hypothetical protein